jgi:SAM-dependent methyltransferase
MHTNPFASETARYAHLRPTYPDGLFTFLSTTVASRDVAWDCATGNGQAARHLAKYFGRVIAIDESAEMMAQAPRDTRIEYRVAEAEDSGIETHSIDLVTVASAIHCSDGLRTSENTPSRNHLEISQRVTIMHIQCRGMAGRGSFAPFWRPSEM